MVPLFHQCPPPGSWSGSWAVEGHHLNLHLHEIWPVLFCWFFGLTLIHWFLLRKETSFSVCGSATSPHPAFGFLWPVVQVKVTQGAAEPLISRMWWWGDGERETGACLDVGARDSGIFATGSYTWNGNIASLFLIALSKHLLLDIWLTPPLAPSWRRPSPWGEMAMGASPTLWSGPSQPWSALQASSGHALGQFKVYVHYALFLPPAEEHTRGQDIIPPQKSCLAIFNISPSVDPKRILMEECSRAIILAVSGHVAWEHLWDSLSCSLLLMVAALWSRHSSKKRPHSWCWAVFQARCSLR